MAGLILEFVRGQFTSKIGTPTVSDVVKSLFWPINEAMVKKNAASVAHVVPRVLDVLSDYRGSQNEAGFLQQLKYPVVCLSHPFHPRSAHTGSSEACSKIALVGRGRT